MGVRQSFRNAGPFLAQTVAVAVLVWTALELWRFDFRVQFNYLGDSLWFALLAKSVTHNGWAFLVPQLSAPYGLAAAAFPTMTNFDWLIMKAISLISDDPAIVFNVFWLCTIFFTAWTALLSLRLLGVPRWLAALGGLLYTAIPYTWLRSTGHLSLGVLFRPLAVRLRRVPGSRTRGPVERRDLSARRSAGGVHAGIPVPCISAGSRFCCLGSRGSSATRIGDGVTSSSGRLSALSSWPPPPCSIWRHLSTPGRSMACRILATRCRLKRNCTGLKIRRMLVPHPGNPIPPFSSWATRDLKAGVPEREREPKRQAWHLWHRSGSCL